MSNEGSTPSAEDLGRSLAEILRLIAAAQTTTPDGPPTSGNVRKPVDVGPDVADIFQFLSQAWLAYVSSGLRYWSRMADAWVKALPSLARTFAAVEGSSPSDPNARAVVVDELRAWLRDLADYPSQESRLLQAELDKLATALWPTSDSSQDGSYWRRWETKP